MRNLPTRIESFVLQSLKQKNDIIPVLVENLQWIIQQKHKADSIISMIISMVILLGQFVTDRSVCLVKVNVVGGPWKVLLLAKNVCSLEYKLVQVSAELISKKFPLVLWVITAWWRKYLWLILF